MAEVDLFIAGRSYRVACRDGEEETLKKAASLLDAKSREALAGLGTLSEARQFLFAGLLLADQLLDEGRAPAASAAQPPPPPPAAVDPVLAERAERLALRLESLAESLEAEAART